MSAEKKRFVSIAVLLSILTPRIGHIYNGLLKKGLLLLSFWVIAPNILWALNLDKLFWGLILMIIFAVVFWLYVLVDVILLTLKNKSYNLKKFNTPILYFGLLILVGTFNYFFNDLEKEARTYVIVSPSMYPTLQLDDRIWVDLEIDKNTPFNYGDLVVYTDGWAHLVCRIAGLPGDTIAMSEDALVINGDRQKSKYLRTGIDHVYELKIYQGSFSNKKHEFSIYNEIPKFFGNRSEMENLVVEENQFFILADNRTNGLDSRDYGTIKRDSILGKPLFIYWSKERTKIGENLNKQVVTLAKKA